ncbi:unnamed protein product, partial [Meganyctiphanes norvegica]
MVPALVKLAIKHQETLTDDNSIGPASNTINESEDELDDELESEYLSEKNEKLPAHKTRSLRKSTRSLRSRWQSALLRIQKSKQSYQNEDNNVNTWVEAELDPVSKPIKSLHECVIEYSKRHEETAAGKVKELGDEPSNEYTLKRDDNELSTSVNDSHQNASCSLSDNVYTHSSGSSNTNNVHSEKKECHSIEISSPIKECLMSNQKSSFNKPVGNESQIIKANGFVKIDESSENHIESIINKPKKHCDCCSLKNDVMTNNINVAHIYDYRYSEQNSIASYR